MRTASRTVWIGLAIAWLTLPALGQAQQPRLIRSLSGPSGKVVGSQFILDETRSRFVYPQDRSLVLYFEWEFVPGDHVLTATWKQPDGRIASVSPEVRMQTTSKELNAYWIFSISPNNAAGTWTVEIRIDGHPAGSHAFELAGVDASGGKLTLDQVFKTYGPAIVRVHKLDGTGRRLDSGSGFVMAPQAVATAFQSIDGAERFEVEFADGRRVQGDELVAVSRLGDWAVLKADTGTVVPIPRGDSPPVPVGSRLASFVEDSGARVVVPMDVGAVSVQAPYGTRIRVSPGFSLESVGAPVIDEQGNVVGILGGSLTPGSRIDQHSARSNIWLSRQQPGSNAATGMKDVPSALPATARKLAELHAQNIFTTPLTVMPEFIQGGTTSALARVGADHTGNERSEFSSRDDAQVAVYSYWVKKSKLTRGEVGAAVFDVTNTLRLRVPPRKVSLQERDQRFSFTFSPNGWPLGYYRIDVTWDGKPAWRTYIRIVD